MLDATTIERFSNRSEDYGQYRPDYPREIVLYLRDAAGLEADDVIADVGSGTGIFSELLLRDGFTVFAIEPNANMRAIAETRLRSYPSFMSVAATAENTTLPGKSIDLVTAAQAFHWFNTPGTRNEFMRIAKPGAHCFLAWNILQTNTPFLEAYQKLKNKYAIQIKGVRRADMHGLEYFFKPVAVSTKKFHHTQTVNADGLCGLLSSSSIVPARGDPGYDIMLTELRSLFSKHNEDGVVKIEYETQTFLAKLQS